VKQGKDIMRRVLRKSRKLLEQREVQLKPEHLGERNPEIARTNPGLCTVTARFSLQKTQNLPRKVLGKRRRQTNPKKGGRRLL
jgi:hypothetical protein